jgi:hypothetical protein
VSISHLPTNLQQRHMQGAGDSTLHSHNNCQTHGQLPLCFRDLHILVLPHTPDVADATALSTQQQQPAAAA